MFLAPLEILPFDASVIWHYGDLCAGLERRGQPIGALDTMIAAHALASNTILVSNNTRELARVPELGHSPRARAGQYVRAGRSAQAHPGRDADHGQQGTDTRTVTVKAVDRMTTIVKPGGI
jgi:hypothetical protein